MTRGIILAAALMAFAPAQAATWVAVCMGGGDLQYNQTIGGTGYLHMADSSGSYETVRLTQTFYNGKAVCGAAEAKSQQGAAPIAQVCASLKRQSIYVKYRGEKAQGLPDDTVAPYCKALVRVYDATGTGGQRP